MSDELLIRLGEDHDAEVLVKSNIAMARETERKKLSPDMVVRGVQTLLKDPRHGFYVVAEMHHEVVGSLMVTYEWSDWRDASFWWIQSVYIKPEFRKQGVFKRLYRFVKEKAAQDSHVCGLRLYVERDNTAAQTTYEKIGMSRMPYLFYEESFAERKTHVGLQPERIN